MLQGLTKIHKVAYFQIEIFFFGLMDSHGFGLVDSNSFLCTGIEGYVSVVRAVYVTLIACLPVLWKDPSSVVPSEVSAFSVES